MPGKITQTADKAPSALSLQKSLKLTYEEYASFHPFSCSAHPSFSQPIYLYLLLLCVLLLLMAVPVYAADPDDYIDLRFRSSWKEPGSAVESGGSGVTHRAGEIWTEPTTGMEFVWIPAGCFMMGSVGEWSDEKYSNEKPLQKVCVDGFWMGKYEVTNAQYRKFMPDHNSTGYLSLNHDGDRQPVVRVSWVDADKFAKWLSSKDKIKFRLPDERQWEYAARAGTSSKRYWGDSDAGCCAYANVFDLTAKNKKIMGNTPVACDDGYAATAPVGSFRPNRFGLYDMLGNVWEWCDDWNRERDKLHYSKPAPTGKGAYIRGGGYTSGLFSIRSARRNGNNPVYQDNTLGFRLVREE